MSVQVHSFNVLKSSANSPKKFHNSSLSLNRKRHDKWMLKWRSRYGAQINPGHETDQGITSNSGANAYFRESLQVVTYEDIRKVFEIVVLRSMIKELIAIDRALRMEFDRASVTLKSKRSDRNDPIYIHE